MSSHPKEPARLQADELRIKREIVDAAVSNFQVFKAAFEANDAIVQRFSEAAQTTPKLQAALEQLQSQSKSLVQVGQTWRTDKQVATAAVAQHQKLLELLEAPQTIDVCVRSEMYHEALLALEHVHSFAAAYGDRSTASDDKKGTPMLIAKLLRDVNATLQKLLTTVVIPRLATNISLSLAIKLTTFLRRLGVGEPQLRQLFLAKRSEHIDSLTSEAEASSTAAYSCLTRLLTAMKVQGSEVVTQFHACFSPQPTREGQTSTTARSSALMCDELAHWTALRTSHFVQLFERKLPQIGSCAEIASLMEQSHNASGVLAKVGLDMTPILIDLLTERIVAIFVAQISGAEQSYAAAMSAHAWKSQPSSFPTQRQPQVVEGSTPAGSTLAPPVVLLHLLPLSYAMNGVLTACNDIRKCAVPAAAGRCTQELTRFLLRIADDITSAQATSGLLDESEQKGVTAFADAFVCDFLPHVVKCLERLFSTAPYLSRSLSESVLSRAQFAQRHHPMIAPNESTVGSAP